MTQPTPAGGKPASEELKPCPWCGGQPKLSDYRYYSDETGESEGYAAVECHCLGANGGLLFHFGSLPEAIAAWNRRAPNPALSASESDPEKLQQRVAELEKERDEAKAALEPFSEVAERLDSSGINWGDDYSPLVIPPLSAFRRARSLLTKESPDAKR